MTPQGAPRLFKDLYITARIAPRRDVITSETFQLHCLYWKEEQKGDSSLLKSYWIKWIILIWRCVIYFVHTFVLLIGNNRHDGPHLTDLIKHMHCRHGFNGTSNIVHHLFFLPGTALQKCAPSVLMYTHPLKRNKHTPIPFLFFLKMTDLQYIWTDGSRCI